MKQASGKWLMVYQDKLQYSLNAKTPGFKSVSHTKTVLHELIMFAGSVHGTNLNSLALLSRKRIQMSVSTCLATAVEK